MVLSVKVSPDLIAGGVAEGYGKVADVFRRNMTSGEEIGAAVAVYSDGAKVVDLWGGYRNGITKARWQEDTKPGSIVLAPHRRCSPAGMQPLRLMVAMAQSKQMGYGET